MRGNEVAAGRKHYWWYGCGSEEMARREAEGHSQLPCAQEKDSAAPTALPRLRQNSPNLDPVCVCFASLGTTHSTYVIGRDDLVHLDC